MLTHLNGSLWTMLDAPAKGIEIARVGWGTRDSLALPSSEGIPGIWLCNPSGGGFQPVIQRTFVARGTVSPIILGGCEVGSLYETEDAQYVLLMGVGPTDLNASRGEQAFSAFVNLEMALQSVGFTFHDVVRTWLYLDKLLEWYDELNRARDAFFESRKIFGGFVPASTGIGSANLTGSAIITGAIAMRPKHARATKAMLESPLQCSALDYRSSFSRAAEIVTPDFRTVFVSGTASIEPGGKTIHVGDPAKQIELTMEVVQAILATRQMTFKDTSRAIAYLKHPAYHAQWQAWLSANGLPSNFAQEVVADVCRDDLLFELELDAVKRV